MTGSGKPVGPEFFSSDFSTARQRFRHALGHAGGTLHSLPIDAKGPQGEELTIDIGWFGPERPRRALLHSSGLHGVEAFAGSAIQIRLLGDLPPLPSDTALVIAHVLNPYGMAWLRRFNENNVDLNRNFLPPHEKYAGAPAHYAKLDPLLNPRGAPSVDFFLPRALWKIARYGFATLKQAIGGGQYEYPRGLMFGGKQLQQGPERLLGFLAPRLGGAASIFAIDVHTGLGKFGQDTLLTEPSGYETMTRLFGERVAPLDAEHGPAYRTTGSIDGGIRRTAPRASFYFLCQEFGTYGPLRIVQALRDENRWHHYGSGAVDHPAKKKLKAIFCPEDDRWRAEVVRRGHKLLEEALQILKAAPT